MIIPHLSSEESVSDYATLAYDAARKRAMTVADANALDYKGTADLAGVVIGEKGDSAGDFFHESIKQQLITELQADEGDLALKAKLDEYRAKFAAITTAVVMVDQNNDFRLFLDGKMPEGVVEKKWRPVVDVSPIAEAVP